MAVPLIILGGLGLYGAVKGISGAIDHSDASDINDDAKSIVNNANRKVDEQRKRANAVLEDYGLRKLRAFDGVIPDFLENFGRLKNVDLIKTPELEKLNLGDFSSVSIDGLRNDYELLKNSSLGVGAGLGSGAALAFGAYSGTMLLATASTGTAISTLTGVAATNATLAWLGGGAIATGGGGIAMGTMVLGAVVAGPALAIFGHIVGNKGEEALNNARSNLEQARTIRDKAGLTVTTLQSIEEMSAMANATFSKISTRLRYAVVDLKSVINVQGDDYQAFSPESREVVFRVVKLAQLLKAMIDTPILDQDGKLVLSTQRVQEIKQAAD